MSDIDIIKETGLTEREAKVYLATLDLGSTTIGQIIEKTRIPSSKIYDILSRLEKKGLINHMIIKNKKHFQASTPQIILEQLERKTEKFREHIEELKERQKLAGEKQFAEFYEGKEAIFNMLRNTIKNAKLGEEYYNFAFDDEYKEQDLAAFLCSITLLKKERGINIKTLGISRAKKIIEQAISPAIRKAMKIRYTTARYPEGIIILGDNLIMIEWEQIPSAVKIHCRTFADNHKRYFEEEYAKAKP